MLTLMGKKKILRAEYNRRRCALSRSEWERRSEIICARLEQSGLFQNTEVLFTYVSAKDNEVDTHGIIDHALASGKEVLIPVTTAQAGEMHWSRLYSRSDLVRVRFGLLEPAAGKEARVLPPEDGLCLVPGIAFTATGTRLGYGGGYYDRFLALFRGISIGLAFEIQMAPELPITALDQPVRYVLTESNWYERQSGPSSPE